MKTAYQTDIGKQRSQNQDRVRVFHNGKNMLAIVTDGIGGNRSGDVAATIAIDQLGRQFMAAQPQSVSEAKQWFQEQVLAANALILKKSQENQSYQGMGTTLVVALFFNDQQVVVANIGDSRGYIYHDGLLTQITIDHSLVNELVKNGDLSEDAARVSPQKNIITRAIGISPDAQIEVNSFPVNPGDLFLLCSDGLSKMVNNEQIKAVLSTDQWTLGEKCQRLVSLANQAGGPDNVTVLISQNN
ncbi:putative serine/threonine phosphatase stp [Limosilactobacillus coleohominis 101-4-CHN]|uniref:Putative serine/threonine phosphatase stp n=1 Tax=Limosilactobacillus coleohominis 101-4-CHN TaxID=575594 RepID=C7XUP9_9LACO|nr:Stp1/IreP family PP2C-type Ser/Thr phosphatase [Limosilactobacillus coleohominis]EEU31010.1 putative serine/threonine phosphatase stp [Limosilactobacillus coleohominis 101-4-CHN]